MNNRKTLVVVVCATLVAGVIPIAVSVVLGQRMGRQLEEDRLLGYATALLQRSERATQQAYAGIERLNHGHTDTPCAPEQIALMAEIDLTSADLQAMAYIDDGRLLCTSLGSVGAGAPIAASTVTQDFSSGVQLYTHAHLGFAPGMTFTIVARHGYAAVIHEAIPLDIATPSDQVSLATWSPRNKAFRSVRGAVKNEWLGRLKATGNTTFDDGAQLVALVPSQKYHTVTVAAMPLSEVWLQMRRMTAYLLPFGLAVGGALAFAAFLLARQQMGMPALLRRALNKNELFLLYQPIVELNSGRCIGAEALVRWQRSDGSVVPPDVFIPVAEESGQMPRVTEQVLEMVATDVDTLFAQHPQFHIGINLAAADLHSFRTVELLERLLRKTAARAHNILVEATERGLMDATEVRQVIHAIRALGIEVAVDDFGTGYSSLSYLESFALDYLKIDKSFVDTLATDAVTNHVALHIIEMAKSLELKMIAEGVETEAQAALLRERGVQFAQGWLFARPMPMAALRAYVTQQGAPS